MKVVSTDVLGSLGELLDRDCWREAELWSDENTPMTISVDGPNGPTLYTTAGVLRKARRAYFAIKDIYESKHDLRKTIREEVYAMLDEIIEKMKERN